MIRMIYLYFILTLFVSNSYGQSRDFVSDIKRINLKYFETPKYSMEIKYKLYLDKILDSETKSVYYKNKSSFYYKMEGVEVLQNDLYLVTVDNNEKQIVVKKKLVDEKSKKDIFKINFDDYLKKYDSIKTSISGNKISYHLDIKKDYVRKIDLTFNSASYFVERLFIVYSQPYQVNPNTKKIPALEITFSKINLKPTFNPLQFSEKQFFTTKNKKFIPIGMYKDYEVYDFIHNN
jgi:hypothetical protein